MTTALKEKIKKIEKKTGRKWKMFFKYPDSPDEIIKKAGKHGVEFDDDVAREAYEILTKDEVSYQESRGLKGR